MYTVALEQYDPQDGKFTNRVWVRRNTGPNTYEEVREFERDFHFVDKAEDYARAVQIELINLVGKDMVSELVDTY